MVFVLERGTNEHVVVVMVSLFWKYNGDPVSVVKGVTMIDAASTRPKKIS